MSTTGGPGRTRSGSFRVLVVLAVAVVVVATGVVVVVRAGAGGGPAPRPTSTIGRGTHVCVVLGTPGPEGPRFLIPLRQALKFAEHDLMVAGSLQTARGAGVARMIERYAGQGCNLIATTGIEAAQATAAAARAHPDVHFAVLGATTDPRLPNLTVVRFHLDQPAFLAGYLAAGLSRTGIVGAFGSVHDPVVIEVLDAFSAGVQKLNLDRDLAIPLLGWNARSHTGLFAGSVDDVEAGRRAAQRLVGNGADVVLAVAGNAARGAGHVTVGVGDAWMIGTGWDWARTAHAPHHWITTIQERAAVMLRLLIDREVRDGFRPGFLEATLRNDGVGLAQLHGAGETLSGKLTYSMQLLTEQLADGTLSTNPSDYPPPVAPGATPSGAATEPGGDPGD